MSLRQVVLNPKDIEQLFPTIRALDRAGSAATGELRPLDSGPNGI